MSDLEAARAAAVADRDEKRMRVAKAEQELERHEKRLRDRQAELAEAERAESIASVAGAWEAELNTGRCRAKFRATERESADARGHLASARAELGRAESAVLDAETAIEAARCDAVADELLIAKARVRELTAAITAFELKGLPLSHKARAARGSPDDELNIPIAMLHDSSFRKIDEESLPALRNQQSLGRYMTELQVSARTGGAKAPTEVVSG